jgi:hypothetical protein
MTKNEAHAHLNRLREGHPMPVALTTQALLLTGDIPRISYSTLCFDGSQSQDDRAIEAQMQGTESTISYSRYLDCPTNKGT